MFGKRRSRRRRRQIKTRIKNSRISEFVIKLIVVAEWDGTSEGGTGLARLTIRCHP
jgi:hypothetical protein